MRSTWAGLEGKAISWQMRMASETDVEPRWREVEEVGCREGEEVSKKGTRCVLSCTNGVASRARRVLLCVVELSGPSRR
jgi:hypothetical protein